jgi:uncharacterized protein with HEPN domain
MIVDAVVRNIEVIGEAAKKVPLPVQQAYPAATMVADVSDAHRISTDISASTTPLWRVATQHLPANYQDLLNIVFTERANSS